MVLTKSQVKLNLEDKIPDFHLKGIDGETHSLDEFSDYEGFLVIFMCNHCPYVRVRIDSIVKLYEKFRDKIAVIGINSNDPEYLGEGMENMKKFAQDRRINFPYLLDDTQEVAKVYGATCTPDPFLFNEKGKLVFHGRIDNALTLEDQPTEQTMEDNIQKMLKDEKIEKWFEPSIGCSIKWKE